MAAPETKNYIDCKSADCRRTFFMLRHVSDWSVQVCNACQVEIEQALTREEFEDAQTRLRRKKLTAEDVPEWVTKTVENELPVEKQTLMQYGEEHYEEFLKIE